MFRRLKAARQAWTDPSLVEEARSLREVMRACAEKPTLALFGAHSEGDNVRCTVTVLSPARRNAVVAALDKAGV